MTFIKALIQRLETIRTENGYPLSIKKVSSKPEMSTTYNKMYLPMLEVILGDTQFKSKLGGNLEIETEIIVRIVAEPSKDDAYMELLQSCVFRCIFANSYTQNNNNGATLIFDNKHTVKSVIPLAVVTDLNLIESNRIWNVVFSINRNSHTYNI